jgi:hypothetical protein
MIYLLQITTNDFLLQLRTECTADTISGLQKTASEMVKKNPVVKGMTYRIFTYIKKNDRFESSFLKEGIVSK